MKNAIKFFLIVALSMAAMSVSAQTKLGHIEFQKLVQAMPEWTAAQKQLEAKQADVEKELTNLKEQLQTKLADYSKNAKTYSEIIRTSKEQELQELDQRIQRFQQIAIENLDKTQKDLMNPIIEKAINAIKAVGKKNGFTYIYDMNAGSILFAADNTTDVLPLVKKELGIQ